MHKPLGIRATSRKEGIHGPRISRIRQDLSVKELETETDEVQYEYSADANLDEKSGDVVDRRLYEDELDNNPPMPEDASN